MKKIVRASTEIVDVLKALIITEDKEQPLIAGHTIEKKWTVELRSKFDSMRNKMPWYVVQNFSSIAGIRFIKEEWQFKARSAFVKVRNSQGKVIHPNAIHQFWVMGIEALKWIQTLLSNG
ncbi:hypothetical protein FNV43_RR01526 [Rhamnella rubrinervis]|uniref:Uncharacterized protein n=1 Tax=Rhamnella rubrinervis TaxID=2594499 RepID=A0A8K0HPT2_9ROSA|nr:hypothetical protein FNV43_RR01526 [Rhamnella rubrinervis]